MSHRKVALASLGLSVLVTVGLTVVLLRSNGQRSEKLGGDSQNASRQPPAASLLEPAASLPAPAASPPAPAASRQPPAQSAMVVESDDPRATPEELPIEELLAGAGEDPGAVYYTSRVREALQEGNPLFARELLRQMAELHPSSVLLDEAAALCAER